MSEEITDETEYWDNGMVKVEFRNKAGILEGLATHWYWSGNKKSKVLWKNGQRKDSKLCGLSLVKRNMEIFYG